MYEQGPRFTAKELARLFGVRPATVTDWHTRGHLRVVGHQGRANLYDYWEAVSCERARRNHPNLRVPRTRLTVSN